MTLRERLAEIFTLDLRSLAILRIALGLAVAYDALTRSVDLVAHYSEAGLLPVAQLEREIGVWVNASLHAWASASPAALAALFAVQVLAAVALLLGLRTRIATFVCFVLVVGVQLRNPWTARMGGDTILRVLLFWSLLLPLGERFSLDARGRAPGPNRLRSGCGAVLLLQIALLYVVTGLVKNGPAWRDGSAVHYALNLDYWATPFGVWLREQRALLPLLTHATRWFEILGPAIAFVPFCNAGFRMLAVALFVGFHLSLAAALDIGPFPIFCIVAWTAFLPSRLWDVWLPRLRGRAAVVAAHPPRRQALWLQTLALFLFAQVIVFVATNDAERPGPVVRASRTIVSLARLGQRWSMFSPDPWPIDYWPMVEGVLANGQRVDLFQGGRFSRAKPASVRTSLPDFRWKLYFEKSLPELRERPAASLYSWLGEYLCRAWDPADADGQELVRVRLHVANEPTLPDGPGPMTLTLAYQHSCAEAGPGARR